MNEKLEQKEIEEYWIVGTTRENASKTLEQMKTILELAGNDITVTLAASSTGKIPLEIFDNTQCVRYRAKYNLHGIIRDTDVPAVYAADVFEEIKKGIAEQKETNESN